MSPLRRTLPTAVRDLEVGRGEKVLAGVETADGVVAGTRDALYLHGRRIPWEQVENAEWDREEEVLTVTEVGEWGRERPTYHLRLGASARFLQLVRERVSASVVLQRHVPVHGRKGLFVVARRAPRGDQPIKWVYEFQAGVDPDDPAVRRAAEDALARAQEEIGG